MKYLYFLALVTSMAGCATNKNYESSAPKIVDGVWEGTLKWEAFNAKNNREEGVSRLLVASCNGNARVWANRGGDKYEKLGEKYIVKSSKDTNLIYFLDSEPQKSDWTEIQTYTLLQINYDRAALQWTRAVNKRDAQETAEDRYYFNHGIGQFIRVGKECDARLVP